MAFIQCSGCGAVHEATLAACPSCGRCPGCGAKLVSQEHLKEPCPACGLPYCDDCGRCPGCGQSRSFTLEPCQCGHPSDPARVAQLERTFGLRRAGR